MSRLVLTLVISCLTTVAGAHPGNGIVVAADGTVYFADVGRETIWKLDPAGVLTPAVRDRWTHSLFLAEDGTLYYEREEPVEGVAPCSFWSITPDGTHRQLIPPQPDRRRFGGGDFAVDAGGNVYYAHSLRDADGRWRTRIMRRTPAGGVTPFTGLGTGALFTDGDAKTATIRIVTAMTTGPDGRIYFADRDHVRRVEIEGDEAGRVTTVASGLIDAEPADPPERRGPGTTINRLYGLAVASSGDVLVAYQAGRRVIRVRPDGIRATVRTAPDGWSPLGVATRGDAVYVLEVADASIERLRVVRVAPGRAPETMVTLE